MKTEKSIRIKNLEQRLLRETVSAQNFIYARLDGRAFNRFTSRLTRPFDPQFHELMVESTRYLCKEAQADFGYTQNDEISLIWMPKENKEAEFLFGGKLFKLHSVLASMLSGFFQRGIIENVYLNNRCFKIPAFDCRIVEFTNINNLAEIISWRVGDAKRNSVQAHGREYFSEKALHQKGSKHVISLLKEKGLDYNELPENRKIGSFVIRESIESPIPAEYKEFHQSAVTEVVCRTEYNVVDEATFWEKFGF